MVDINKLINELTLDEKINLVTGYKSWKTYPVKRLNIPSIHLTDGPLGVRKQNNEKGSVLGLGNSYPSTSFPAPVNIANSFNAVNAFRMGKAIGEECEAYDVQVLLGPGLNIKRDPRCGRNFEYYSEDPLLSGTMAGNFISGVQSTNTAACMKHFAINNSENYRYMGSSEIDERAANEIYYKSFEIANRIGRPKTIMCAYNKINGTHCSENYYLTNTLLRKKWKFDGLVMTDWGATKDRVTGIKSGIDLDMPGGCSYNKKQLKKAIKNNELSIKDLDVAVKNVLNLVFSFKDNKKFSQEEIDLLLKKHNKVALDLAIDSAILLKNQNNILPINKNEKVLIVGELFEKMRYQGAGSSNLNPAILTNPIDSFLSKNVNFEYLKGYYNKHDRVDKTLENEVVEKAKNYNKVLFFAGLTDSYESEGYDRENILLPKNQVSLINKLSKTNDVIVILFGGSQFEIPFVNDVKAILNMYLPGQAGGEAVRKIIFGEANPSGRLSETWMKSIKDMPFYQEFSTSGIERYKENIFVGYRYFDFFNDKVLYPFGYGLSYSNFSYVYKSMKLEDNLISVTCEITNTSNIDGNEVIQLYVGKNKNTKIFKANKELKDYKKVFIKAKETKQITLSFKVKDLAYYNNKLNQFIVENGTYPIYIASNCNDIKFEKEFVVMNYKDIDSPYEQEVLSYYNNLNYLSNLPEDIFNKTLRKPTIIENNDKFTLETPLREFKKTKSGLAVFNLLVKFSTPSKRKINKIKDEKLKEEYIKNNEFLVKMIPSNTLRSIVQSSGGLLSMNLAKLLLKIANISKKGYK